MIIALNPVVTSLVLVIALGHRENLRGVLALALASGAVVLASAPEIVADHSIGVGLFAVVLATLGLSAGGVYQGRHCAGMDPWLVTAIGATASIPAAAVAVSTTLVTVTQWPHALILLAAMVILTSVGASTLYAGCIRHAGARASSALFAVIPAVASLMAWAALNERLTVWSIAGLLLGAVACLLQSRSGGGDDKLPRALIARHKMPTKYREAADAGR